VESDPSAFDCETCPVRQRHEALDERSRRAIGIWGRVNRRYITEAGLTATLLTDLTQDWEPSDRVDLLDRLALMYDVLVPSAADET
jgi:hypothetical protein